MSLISRYKPFFSYPAHISTPTCEVKRGTISKRLVTAKQTHAWWHVMGPLNPLCRGRSQAETMAFSCVFNSLVFPPGVVQRGDRAAGPGGLQPRGDHLLPVLPPRGPSLRRHQRPAERQEPLPVRAVTVATAQGQHDRKGESLGLSVGFLLIIIIRL